MITVNFRSFKQKLRYHRRSFRSFLTKLEKNPPKELHTLMEQVDKEVWAEIDCLSCGNCCKQMTPTFSVKDIQRISAHFEITKTAFKEKWLKYDKKTGDWQNKTEPCQFLNQDNNKCSIYPIRPADCAGFPHLTKKKAVDYIHVHKQNIQYCPATYKMVEKMKALMSISIIK
ncbi:MAG: YkgJ family cysteine cluster protein [Ferruginibacter sp.]